MEMFIDGAWRAGSSVARMEITSPVTGALVDTVPLGDAADADAAIASAARAMESWKRVPMPERVALQKKLAQAMRDNAEDVGKVLHSELGRPLAACVGEITRSADLLDVYAEEGLRLRADLSLAQGAGEKIIVSREPVGVVVAITPFNYPITLLMFKLGAALIAGCTVVAKPAEDTPLSTLMLADIFHMAGLPAGAFNVVTGDGRGIGAALIEHPVPRKIAFTGGTAAGKAIAAAAAGTMKRLTLELGGQSAAIVCVRSERNAGRSSPGAAMSIAVANGGKASSSATALKILVGRRFRSRGGMIGSWPMIEDGMAAAAGPGTPGSSW